MSISVLGLSAYYHDSTAALVVDGKIAAAAQEERFTRVKGEPKFPEHSVRFCLQRAGIDVADIDHVVYYEKPMVKFERLLENYATFAPRGFRSFSSALARWSGVRLSLHDEIRQHLGRDFCGDISFSDHHESHAASAFFPSPFEQAAILTLDGVGEWSTSSVGLGTGNHIELLREMRYPHSLGMLYSAFTSYVGFKVNSGEYKLMGLAPYGEPRYADLILERLVDLAEDGSLWLDLDYFDYCHGDAMTSARFHELFEGPPRHPEETITQKHMDLAASIQSVCETTVVRCARYAHELTNADALVMAGGVALNCVANGRVLREGPFDRLWIQPAAGDAGAALGAALLYWHHVLDAPRTVDDPDAQRGSLLGPDYANDDIGAFLDSVGAVSSRLDDEDELLDEVARLIEAGSVVGWFQGGMEFGPRALGNRSILGDPRSSSMQQVLNLKVKFRESFRPFAPSILRDHAHEVFEMREGEDDAYMLTVAPVREGIRRTLDEEDRVKLRDPDLRVRLSVDRSVLPAITHVDYSARVQTVDQRHGRYWRLLRRFYERTGCPVVVNTSFNVRGEPIVCTPAEAYRCFSATDIDCLVLGDYVLYKDTQPRTSIPDPVRYREQFVPD